MYFEFVIIIMFLQKMITSSTKPTIKFWGAIWPSGGRASDSELRGPGFDPNCRY